MRTGPPELYDRSFVVALVRDFVAHLVVEFAVDFRVVEAGGLEVVGRLDLFAGQLAQLAVAVAAFTVAIAVASSLRALRHLADAVRQERHLAGDADRARHGYLLLLRVARDPAGADLRALRHEPAQQVHVLVVDPVDALGDEDRRLLLDRAPFLAGRRLLLSTLCHPNLPNGSERFFAVVVVVLGRSGRSRRSRGAAGRPTAAPAPVAGTAALDLVDLGGREAQA